MDTVVPVSDVRRRSLVPLPRISRRSLLAATPAVVLAGTALGSRPAAAAAAIEPVPARRSDALADMFGVVAVTSTKKGIWGQHAQIQSRLVELGVRYVRNCLFAGNKGQIEFIQQLAGAGLRFNLLMGDPTNRTGTPEQLVQLAASQLRGAVASFEGANEWNLVGGANWVGELRAHQRRLYKAAKSDSRVSAVPVLGPALGLRQGHQALGDLTDALDMGAMHLYQGGFAPGYRVDEQLDLMTYVCGNKPVCVTETGWHNAVNSTSGHHYTPEDVAALYAPRVYLDYFRRQSPRVFLFQLLDDSADPAMVDQEAHFGLLRNDFSRKPLFNAMANLMALTADPGPAYTPDSLRYEVAGAPDDLRQVLLQRRDGTFVLMLWRDVAVWDPIGQLDLPVPPRTFDVRFAAARTVRTYRPSLRTDPVSVETATSGTTLSLAGEVVALELPPG